MCRACIEGKRWKKEELWGVEEEGNGVGKREGGEKEEEMGVWRRDKERRMGEWEKRVQRLGEKVEKKGKEG